MKTKQSQWFSVDRETAEQLALPYNNFTNNYDDVFAPDECYFTNLLDNLKIKFIDKPITFVQWFRYESSHPMTFHKLSKNIILRI